MQLEQRRGQVRNRVIAKVRGKVSDANLAVPGTAGDGGKSRHVTIIAAHMNFRVFETDVALRSSKWTSSN